MSASSLLIRRATEADEERVLELVRASLGEGTVPRTAAYWRWKHMANPFGPSPVLVAEDDGQLVGLRAFMRWTWHSGNERAQAVRAVDTGTAPQYRGRGIFKSLTLRLRDEVEREGVAFVFNTPNAQSRPGYLKMGWTAVGRPTLWVRALRPARLARAMWRAGTRGGESSAPEVHAAPVAEVLHRPGVQALLELVSSKPTRRLHTRPSAQYLRWRYADVPGFAYQAVSRGEGEDGALVILRSRQRGEVRELRLCDTVMGSTPEATRNLRTVLRQASELADVDAVVAMAGGRSTVQRSLLGAGFVPIPNSGPRLVTYPFAALNSLPDPRKLASWATAIGDLELF